MAASELEQIDLDRCIHCGLCLNACPTYRELGVEMDSPRGRIYQMVQVAGGAAQFGPSYVEHLGLCLACRACESACPSGVPYGRLIEAARTGIEQRIKRPWYARAFRSVIFGRLFDSPALLGAAGGMLWLYEATGMRGLVDATRLVRIAPLAPSAERPFYFRNIGKVYPAVGERRYRVAFLAGCIANVCFARLNEATVRVLQKNGCEVVVPAGQTCCGALHVHVGLVEKARELARRNVDAMAGGGYDAIITNAAGCGSTLKEYGELLAGDARAVRFARLVRDVNEFLASIELNRDMRPLPLAVTYQDSCHLAHGQRIRSAPRKLLEAIPGLTFREMPLSDLCCGSAGVYNVVHNDMSDAILRKKMEAIGTTGAGVIATANPGCILQLRAGAKLYGRGQRVAHVIELLDEAYGQAC
ncbi:MAG: (Fe-S)-binding protein [Acidobacteriota bacterium]